LGHRGTTVVVVKHAGLLIAIIWLVVSLIVAIFSFWWGGITYLIGIYAAVAVIGGACIGVQPSGDTLVVRRMVLSNDEERLFRKYYAFFQFPFGAQFFAFCINYSRIFGIVWIVIGLWQGMYWVAIANAVFYLISGPLMWRLAPIAHYNAAAEKGALLGESRMMQNILNNRDVLGF
jgi:hypothetical protein